MKRAKPGSRAAAQAECDRANRAVRRLRRCEACKGDGHYRTNVDGQTIIGSTPCPTCGGSGQS